jgi:hypothetical protein
MKRLFSGWKLVIVEWSCYVIAVILLGTLNPVGWVLVPVLA